MGQGQKTVNYPEYIGDRIKRYCQFNYENGGKDVLPQMSRGAEHDNKVFREIK